MIHVIASIWIKKGRQDRFIEIFKSNIPKVLEEKGCIEYVPTLDVPTELPVQETDDQKVTIIEKWACLDDLMAHLSSPHMQSYREKTKSLVEKMAVNVLKPV